MDVGLLFPFRNPPQWSMPFDEFYSQQISQICLSEKLGYDTVWLTEHHFSEDGYSPSMAAIAGAVAQATTRVRIGTYVLLLPLHHAVRLAEDVATVDIISGGRFDLGVGLGYGIHEFAGFGIPRKDRPSRLEEGIAVVRGLWGKKPFSFDGRHYQLDEIDMRPKPIQPLGPPLWVGAAAPKAVNRAARLGCHFLAPNSAAQEMYDAALVFYGHDPQIFNSAHIRWCYVAPSADEGWDDIQDHVHYMQHWYDTWLSAANDGFVADMAALPAPGELRKNPERVSGSPIVGPPKLIIEELTKMNANTRMTHLVVGMHFPGMPADKTRRSMEWFASDVLPSVRALRPKIISS